MRVLGFVATFATGLILVIGTAASCQERPPGAVVEELLALLPTSSPELAAFAAERQASAARADAADALPDPAFRFLADDVDRDGNAKYKYTLEQEFPLWGKRELRARAALARLDAARAREGGATATLVARLKLAFVDSYFAHRSRGIVQERLEAAGTLATVSVARYAQGIGTTADALRAEAERARLQAELHRLEARVRVASAQVNGVLGRAADAPLAEPAHLPTMPPDGRLSLAALRTRLIQDNPVVQVALAERTAAEHERTLAEREWYPDVSVMIGGIDRRDNGPPGFMAGIGVRIPLQIESRRAAIRAASARQSAASARRVAAERTSEAELEAALGNLAGARHIGRVAYDSLVPQAIAAYSAALLAYEQRRAADISAVLDAHQRLREARIEALSAEVEQHRQLARIERLIGGAP